MSIGRWAGAALVLACAWSGPAPGDLAAGTQGGQPPGRSIGRISTHQDLIVFELNEGALGHANMFDLQKRTVRFSPAPAGGYLVETAPLQWDAEEGVEMTGPQVSLRNFRFPFAGKSWDTFTVGVTGSIAFAPPAGGPGGRAGGAGGGQAGAGGRGGGVTIGRFDQLQEAAPLLVNAQPAICVFMKPRMSGTRAVKELSDRVVITGASASRQPASRTSPGCRPSIDFKPCCTRAARSRCRTPSWPQETRSWVFMRR
jgi:hypothetical protein